MVLSKRERYVFGAAIGLLGLLAADHLVLGPLLQRRSRMDAERAALAAELARDHKLLQSRRELLPLWQAMQLSLRSSPAEAESQILHLVRDAAEESGLDLSLLKPERLADKSRLPQVAFQAAGAGALKSVSHFLWRLETAQVPLRITELQLNSRKEGTDDLSVQLRLSTLCRPDRAPPTAAPGASPPTREEIR